MKQKIVTFRRPVKVFQVFRNTNIYSKRERSLNERKDAFIWSAHSSISGYVHDGILFLNEQILNNPDFNTCNLITLDDVKEKDFSKNEDSSFVENQEKDMMYNGCHSFTYSLRLNGDIEIRITDKLELYLLPRDAQAIPKRDSFKLCDIEINTPVEVNINHKSDFSGSRRDSRIFVESKYIIEYLGEFQSCIILPSPFKPYLKKIPKQTKLIDLLKPLW